jgi:hypothetical protein
MIKRKPQTLDNQVMIVFATAAFTLLNSLKECSPWLHSTEQEDRRGVYFLPEISRGKFSPNNLPGRTVD